MTKLSSHPRSGRSGWVGCIGLLLLRALGDASSPLAAAAVAVAVAAKTEDAPPPRQLGTAVVTTTTTVLLDFEGVGDGNAVGDYYNGGRGGTANNVGIQFDGYIVANVDTDAGGSLPTAHEPSPETVVYYDAGSSVTVAAGFTNLTFHVAGADDTPIKVYDGPNGTGKILAQETISAPGLCGTGGAPSCGDPTGDIGQWFPYTPQFTGIAKSITFSTFRSGNYIDNMVFQVVVASPTRAPTAPPTRAPTVRPATRSPFTPPTCGNTTYWVYNAAAASQAAIRIRPLVNNSVTCLAHPYNVEVRPCVASSPSRLTIRLVRAADGHVLHRNQDSTAPYFLFGNSANPDIVRPSPWPLRNGNYLLSSSVGGAALTFTQSCRCPKGKKGCMTSK